MKYNNEAKERLLVNVGTNLLAIFVSAVIGIWQVPYLIRHLGLDVYGMIPLVISFVAYIRLFTMSISETVSRFVSIHLSKNELQKSNLYFNSALGALAVICALLLIPTIIIAVLFTRIFQVPEGYETATSILFFMVLLSSLIFAIASPFQVSTFVKHRFDLSNAVRISSLLVRVAVLVLCFTYLSPSLGYFGLSQCSMTLFVLVCSQYLTKRLTPELKISPNLLDMKAIREMGQMSSWVIINELGALFYLSISFALINLFLGPSECARYSTIAMWLTFLGSLGSAISRIFAPIAFAYIGRNRIDTLVIQMRRSTKFLGLIMGFPIGLLCGLSSPLLTRWLKEDFLEKGADLSGLNILFWLLIGPWLISITVRPMFSVYRGLNRVKLPALVTLLGGFVNVLLSVVLIRYTDLGIFGVALSLMICLGGKNLFFTPIYAAIITGKSKFIFAKEIIIGLLAALLIALAALSLSHIYDLATIPRLFLTGAVLFIFYAPLCYWLIITKQERRLLLSLIFRKDG